jgi:Tfp pilus assembly protein PilN
MRPVNLIPVEQRQGGRPPMRSGPVAYIVVGALIAALAGVTLLVVTDNQIGERRAEITQLRREDAAVKARAARLAAYTQFRAVHDQRIATVTSLADSRFDWERVMHELALILPGDVWLTNLTGSVNPQVTPEGAVSIPLRAGAPGPALELVGCAGSQDAVAGFVQGLKDIEGVTRVGVQSSTLNSDSANSGSATAGSGGVDSPCQRKSVAQFQIVAAFDAAPVPSISSGTAEGTAAAAPSTGTTTSSTTPSTGSSASTSSTTPSSTTSTTSTGSGEGGEG